jgi:hypothetical protein
VKFHVKVDSLMYYNMSKFHFIILISQFMRAVFRAAHNFWEPLYSAVPHDGPLSLRTKLESAPIAELGF